VHAWRRWARQQHEELQYDIPENWQLEQIYASPYDIFDLTKLFGLRLYYIAPPMENWEVN